MQRLDRSGTAGDPEREDADEAIRGLTITGVAYVHDYIEVHLGDIILTGYTEPFGLMGCQGVGPSSIRLLIGREVDQLTVVEGEYVAIDSGEHRLAFPIGGPSAAGPESVRLYRPAHAELGIPSAHWIWWGTIASDRRRVRPTAFPRIDVMDILTGAPAADLPASPRLASDQ